MRINRRFSFLTITSIVLIVGLVGCTTTKQKDDLSGMGMFFQNMTAHYNGYFNATEILKETVYNMNEAHEDNYNQILPVFEYTAVTNVSSEEDKLDNAIKKASVGISIHRPSKWTDDNYLVIGKSQYLKQDFESAQKTLEYLTNNFNPAKPVKYKKGGSGASKKKSKKDRIVQQKKKKKESTKKKKEKVKQKKEDTKVRATSKKDRDKERKAYNKERKKEIKAREKARKKGKKKSSKISPPKTTTTPIKKEAPKVEKKSAKIVKEEKKDKKEKEKEEKKQDGEGLFSHPAAHPFGLLWLARTYVERDFLTRADQLFNEVESSNPSEDVLADLYPAKAHFYIIQKDYPSAIPALNQAIEHAGTKTLRARYSFILGQLYARTGQHSEAIQAFNNSEKWSTNYEMAFNAKLYAKMSDMKSGSTSEDKIVKELERMLKDDKNVDFTGRIYFQIATIYLEKGDEINAAKYLKLAIEAPGGTVAQKTDMYYALAELFYKKDNFADAYTNYNNAFNGMPKEDERYNYLKKLTEDLSPIAKNIVLIHERDSFIALSKLSDEERKALAKDILTKKKAEEKEANKLASNKAANEQTRQSLARSANLSPVSVNASTTGYKSKFPAYNEKERKKGEKDFERLWGDRGWGNDWRRNRTPKDQITNVNDVYLDIEEDNISDSEIESLFAKVPKDEKSLAAMKADIADALFELGADYRNNIERLDLSSQAFERLVSEFPDSDKILDAYYFLYLNAQESADGSAMKKYGDLITSKFPDSKYAQLIKNPAYLTQLQNENNAESIFYEAVYNDFQNEKYAKVVEAYDVAKTKFGKDHTHIAKLALLRAMAIGKSGDKEQYVQELRKVIAQYPQTQEQIRAREIVRFLTGDDDAFNRNFDMSVEVTNFKVEDDKLHYIVVVLQNEKEVSVGQSKISITAYNRLYHKAELLKIRSFTIDRDKQTSAVMVRKFDNKRKAMAYYEEIKGRKKEFLPKGADADFYAVSQSNYREVIKAGNIESYKTFFKDNYLNK